MVQFHTENSAFGDHINRLSDDIMGEQKAAEVHVWESDRSHFHGRSNDEAYIGLNFEKLQEVEDAVGTNVVDYVIAHELGHDLHHQIYNLERDMLEPESNISEEGKLLHDKGNEDLDSIEDIPGTLVDVVTGEIVAELAAEQTTEPTDPLGRQPFPNDRKSITKEIEDYQRRRFFNQNDDTVADQLRATDYDSDEFAEILDNTPYQDLRIFASVDEDRNWQGDLENFLEHEGQVGKHQKYESDQGVKDNFDELNYHLNLLEEINTGLRSDEIDMKDVVKMAWSKDVAHNNDIEGPSDIFSIQVNQRLSDSFDYEEDIPRYQGAIYESDSEADQVIEEDIDEMLDYVVDRSIDRVEVAASKASEGYHSATPSFSHITAEMDTNEVGANIDFDYSHNVGCTVGRILSEHDVTLDDVREDPEKYRDIAYQAVEEANRIGHQYSETGIEATTEDFENAMNYVVRDQLA